MLDDGTEVALLNGKILPEGLGLMHEHQETMLAIDELGQPDPSLSPDI